MMMMRSGHALMIGLLFALAAGMPRTTQAEIPTDQLRTDIDQLYRSLQRTTPSPSADAAATEILDRMFDWTRMTQAVMGRHWRERTAEERAEFTGLFAGVFRRAYISRIHVVDASKFQYLGDTIDGDRATVKTKVLTKRGSTLDVDYTVRLQDAQRWRVADVRVDRVSLVDNYRTQFETFLARQSYEALVRKLRAAAK